MMTMEQESYWIIWIIKNVINLLVLPSRQKNTSIPPQQINFTGKLEEYDGATMSFITEKQQKTN